MRTCPGGVGAGSACSTASVRAPRYTTWRMVPVIADPFVSVERRAVGGWARVRVEPQREAHAGGGRELDPQPGPVDGCLGRGDGRLGVPVVVEVADPGRVVADGVAGRADGVRGERPGLHD